MAGYIGANTSSVTNNQNAAERRKKFTFTANTTVLSGLNFLPDKIHIFHNGIRLVKNTDFTEAADGQSVTLVNAAQAGDEVVAVTFAQDPASNAGYTDADVDAHLLTAGVTLDAANDRVGFGTASPQQLIDASAASADARIRVHSSTNSTPSAGIELMRGTNTTFGADAYTDFRIENINGGHLAFSTGESGTTTERVRISSNGYVGLGTSASYPLEVSLGQSDAAAKFARGNTSTSMKNLILFRSSSAGADVGSIQITNSATSYVTSSDHRLKENVETLSNGITRVKQLQPKRFSWIVDEEDSANQDGFLAHEAQTVVPEAVTGTHNEVDDDGNAVMQGIDQAKLVPLLTAALQEAITKIEDLETRVAALEAE